MATVRKMSSNTNTNPQAPTATDRTQARGTQFTPAFTAIGQFFGSTRKSISMPIKFADKTGIPDWHQVDKAYVDITYSRAELKAICTTMIETCHANCSGTFGTHIADWDSQSYKDLASAFALTYTVTKGVNKDTVRNHMAHFIAAARTKLKFATAAQDLQETVDNGDAWAAEGVVDKEGNLRPYITEVKARKAHARIAHTAALMAEKEAMAKNPKLKATLPAEWWTDKGTVKQAYLDNAVVFKYNPDGAITMDTIRSMHHVQVRTLAAKAGAPTSITEGAGAKARSINWFSEDVARISAAQV
jgi:hypothetical protein